MSIFEKSVKRQEIEVDENYEILNNHLYNYDDIKFKTYNQFFDGDGNVSIYQYMDIPELTFLDGFVRYHRNDIKKMLFPSISRLFIEYKLLFEEEKKIIETKELLCRVFCYDISNHISKYITSEDNDEW